MKNNFSAVITALFIIVVGFVGVKLTSTPKNEIQGISDSLETTESVNVNQDIRSNTPITTKSQYLEDILLSVADMGNLEIIEIRDNSTFHWTLDTDELEVIGQSLKIERKEQQFEKEVEGFLESEGFIMDEYNLTAGTPGHSTGYINGRYVCVLRSIFTGLGTAFDSEAAEIDLELRCGEIFLETEIQNTP